MTETDRQHYPEPADPVARIAAKVIDLLLAALVSRLVPPIGILLGLVYLLVGDGMDGGRSIGKRLLGLRTVHPDTGDAGTVRQSILRNAHLALLYALMFIPLLGPILVTILGAFVLAVEIYAIFNDRHGLRMGDLFADTIVVGHAWVRLESGLKNSPST